MVNAPDMRAGHAPDRGARAGWFWSKRFGELRVRDPEA